MPNSFRERKGPQGTGGTSAVPRGLFSLASYGKKASGPAIAGNVVATVIATTIARASRAFRLFLMCHLLSLDVERTSKCQRNHNRR